MNEQTELKIKDNAENLLPKCKKCKALVWNAEELIVKRMTEAHDAEV